MTILTRFPDFFQRPDFFSSLMWTIEIFLKKKFLLGVLPSGGQMSIDDSSFVKVIFYN
jgi:hypothetical protein